MRFGGALPAAGCPGPYCGGQTRQPLTEITLKRSTTPSPPIACGVQGCATTWTPPPGSLAVRPPMYLIQCTTATVTTAERLASWVALIRQSGAPGRHYRPAGSAAVAAIAPVPPTERPIASPAPAGPFQPASGTQAPGHTRACAAAARRSGGTGPITLQGIAGVDFSRWVGRCCSLLC